MKSKVNLVFFVIIFFFNNVNLISQQGWYNLNAFGGPGIYFKDAYNGIVGPYKTSNGGMSWNFIGGGGNSLMFPNQNTGYGVSYSICKTTNFGDNWTYQTNPVPSINFQSVYFPNVNTGYACGEDRVIKTTNGGNNWFLLSTPLWLYGFNSIFFTDTITGYIVGHKYVQDSSVFLKTTNGGINWLYQKFATNDWGKFTSLFFIDANTGIVGSTNYILKTTDAGLGWYQIIIPTANRINSLYFPSSSTGYGACYGGQIIKTTNGGNNWFLQNTGTGSALYSIFFINDYTGYASGDYYNNTVLKTTNGGGPPIGIKPISNNIPDKFQLYQNYPNPFNPVTKIKFDIPPSPLNERGDKGGFVTLKIFDALGREVTMLVNEKLAPGIYEIEWNAANFSTGVYFYRIVAGTFADTKKMVLVK